MPDATPPAGSRGSAPGPADGGDLWGPATAVRAGAHPAAQAHDPAAGPRSTPRPPLTYRSPIPDDRPGRGSSRRGRDRYDGPSDGYSGTRAGDRPDEWSGEPYAERPDRAGRRTDPRTGPYATAAAGTTARAHDRPAELEQRGLPGWAGLLLLLVIAGVGGLIDSLSGAQVRGGFNIAIIVASIVAILAVKRSAMFPVVVAPPLVYAGASGAMLYLRSGGLNDRKVLFDAAANWLVYGFPAIAAATAAVLIIAGIRMVVRR